jgi:hypothetical protein
MNSAPVNNANLQPLLGRRVLRNVASVESAATSHGDRVDANCQSAVEVENTTDLVIQMNQPLKHLPHSVASMLND